MAPEYATGTQPGAVVVEAAARYDLHLVVVYSTSWRTVDDQLVLTYLAIVDPPARPGCHLAEVPVLRGDLARGDRLAAPAHVDTGAVIEHALRHLRGLVDDDSDMREALPDWLPALEDRRPEPFRARVSEEP